MGRLKQIAFFLAFILLCGSIGCIFFWDDVAQWIYVLRWDHGEREYIRVAADTDGSMCAAYWKSPTEIGLRFFDGNGKNAVDWTPALPDEAEAGYLAAMYPAGTETAFLAFYEQNNTGLSVYRAKKGETAERLLHADIDKIHGLTTGRDTCRIGAFSRQQDEIRFTLIEAVVRMDTTDDMEIKTKRTGTVTSYACSVEGGGLRQLGQQSIDQTLPEDGSKDDVLTVAVVLPNGRLAMADAEGVTVDGTPLQGDFSESRITRMAISGSALYYMDSTAGVVYYTDLSGMRVQQVLRVQRNSAAPMLTDLALTPSGDVLLLEDGWSLTRLYPGGTVSLSHALNPGKLQSAAMLGLMVLGAAILAIVLGHVFFFMHRGSVSMALYWSFVILSVGTTLGVYLHYEVMLPEARLDQAERYETLVWNEYNIADIIEFFAEDTGTIFQTSFVDSLDAKSFQGFHATNLVPAIWSEEEQRYLTWDGAPPGLIPGFCAELADLARDTQGYAHLYSQTSYATAYAKDNTTVTIILATDTRKPSQEVEPYVLAVLAALSMTAILILIGIGHSIRVLGRGVERYGRQEPWKRLSLETADELEGIASSLNSMAADREMEERNRNRMVESYRRFVPEHVLSLLGRQSILEVDKSTNSSQEMALLMVWFSFPEAVYTVPSNSRLLFDSVNAVIERTAPIATRQGGTVFNYAYDGYDVVMENDPARAVSMAVALQQEVLAFNESRAREGLPTATVRIALDVGNVMLGIVGDSTQMQPTAISSSFTTARELIGLCGQLDAGILCTEAIAPGLKQYGSRFIGKRRTDSGVLRVYEIFDGDPYEVRKEKEATLSRFSKAIMAYYSGDMVQAKRIFLELAHETPRDGGARHYLYLADRLDGGSDHLEAFSL